MKAAPTPELDQLDCVARLRAATAELRAGVVGAAGLWVADRFESYLKHARDGVSLDDAFGVKARAGGEAWWTAEDRRQRDGALLELQRRFPGCELGQEIRAYERVRWKRDRKSGMPADYAGGRLALLYRAFVANESVAPGRMPSGRTYLNGLGASLCGPTEKAAGQMPTIPRQDQMLCLSGEGNSGTETTP